MNRKNKANLSFRFTNKTEYKPYLGFSLFSLFYYEGLSNSH